jgi:hypothetical protein
MVIVTREAERAAAGRRPDRQRAGFREPRFLDAHRDVSGKVRPDLWAAGVMHTRRMNVAAGQWVQIGPAPIRVDSEQIYQGAGPDSGEVVDVAIDPAGSADQVIYIACNDGGIWKSVNRGTSWNPKTDFMPSLSMGAVALDPRNSSTVYAGTGNLFDGGGQFTKGVGIYRSDDGGDTWSVVGASVFTNLGINRIVLPASGVLLVAASNGVYRSIDGGQNFGANAPTFDDGKPIITGYASDLILDSQSPATTAYACIGGQGVFKSTDAGVSFPTNLFTDPGAPAQPYAFISLTQSVQPDGQTMYASVQGIPDYAGLFKSTNGGNNWSVLPAATPIGASGQLGYDQTVGVDPQDPNRVYIGFQELSLSTDGGTTFNSLPVSRNKVHWDHHALVFSPGTHRSGTPPTQLYVGTDGGIATSSDGGGTWSNLNEGIATNIFLGIDVGRGNRGNNAYTYGGTQDTGTLGRHPEFAATDWHLGIDGDGGPVAVDPANPLQVYGSDDGSFIKTTDGGSTWSFAGNLPQGVFRVAVDPNASATVYATVDSQLYQSTDTGANFTLIRTFPAAIASIATVALDSNTLWIGLRDGTVQSTANALAGVASTWNTFTPGAAGSRAAEAIAIDPTDVNRVVVAYSGFSGISPNNRTQHVFQTLDNGATWTDISGTDGGDPTQNLPDLPLHSVVIDRGGLTQPSVIVASDAGVMQTTDSGATWSVLGNGLPTVDCKSLALDHSSSPTLLRVGTYGRSVFEFTRIVQTWMFRNFTAAEGAAAAVNFLNEPARQGAGEASAFVRDDGSVGLFYLEPGSLGSSTQQTWVFQNFTAAEGAAAAVNFLNEPARQGRGQVSAVARTDGSVGLFYLEPGSLGSSTQQTWVFQNFTAAEGAAAAVNFLNEPARQGAGEASAFVRDDGSVGLFYLEPGTG